MADQDSPAHTDYRDWLNQPAEPGWYDPGEGHRIQTAFIAGWRRGVCYLAVQLALATAEGQDLDQLWADLAEDRTAASTPPGNLRGT